MVNFAKDTRSAENSITIYCGVKGRCGLFYTMTGSDFESEDIGRIFSWDAVSEVHRVRHGIYQRSGRLISLLTDFGKINPCYPDFHGDTQSVIHYTGNGRRGDQRLDAFNRALLDAAGTELSVPLFNKHAPGKWEFMGWWSVVDGAYVFDESQSRMVWKFTLRKSE